MTQGNPEIRVGGHRGNGETDRNGITPNEYLRKSPENTVASVETALHRGAQLIEIDVVLSKDGVPMVTHSNDLRQHVFLPRYREQLQKKPYVSQYTAEELQKMRVGHPEIHNPATMPTLAQVMESIARHNQKSEKAVELNIELKDTQGTADPRANQPISLVKAVKKVIEQSAMSRENLILSSFAESLMLEAKQEMPEIRRGMLLTSGKDEDLAKPVFSADSDDMSVYRSFRADDIEELHEKLQLSAVHPEISSLSQKLNPGSERVFNLLSEELRSPQGEKLAINTWFLGEEIGRGHENLTRNAIKRTHEKGLDLGIITNHIGRVKDEIEVYEMLTLSFGKKGQQSR